MNPQNILWLLRVALRLLETFLSRRPPKERPATRADKVMERVTPLAEKVLERVAPETRAAPKSDVETALARSRASASLALARAAVLSAVVSGAAAYVVLRQQRRLRERYRFLQADFPEILLDVLAAPGGGGRLVFSGSSLIDPDTGAVYPVMDGIPDFNSPGVEGDASPAAMNNRDSWLELLEPARQRVMGENRAGNAALAGAAALAAKDGWVLCAPCGLGDYEIEMAWANPAARCLCVSARWEALLETRRRARLAGLTNLYFARGDVTLLPVRGAAMEAIWNFTGAYLTPTPERALTQLARVAKPGAFVAGAALVAGGPPPFDRLIPLPGQPDRTTHLTLLAASGLRDVRSFRDGAFVRFMGVR
jgi:SAM-dependent methyltransferase